MSERPFTPEEERAKEKTKTALTEAIAAVDSPAKAEQVVADLEARVGSTTETDVAKQLPTPADAEAAAAAIQQSAETPHEEKPQHVITETAAQLVADAVACDCAERGDGQRHPPIQGAGPDQRARDKHHNAGRDKRADDSQRLRACDEKDDGKHTIRMPAYKIQPGVHAHSG